MVDYIKKNKTKVILGIFLFLNLLVWVSVIANSPKGYVKVSFLDVGQGDAIFIQARNGNQILIDGGANNSVLRALGRVMPKFDRYIDVLIETHPDADHIGGFPEILDRYIVGAYIEPGVESDNSIDDEIERILTEKEIPKFTARTGMLVDLGDDSFLEVLFPDRDVSGLDPNDASIITKYVYGDTCFVLTGDAPSKMETYVISRKVDVKCQVLKVGHHGSNTSSSEVFLKSVSPEYAIISAGKDNRYGHPHADVVERIRKVGAEILNTANEGTIKMISNGKIIEIK